jgi:N-acetylneuraminate synthase
MDVIKISSSDLNNLPFIKKILTYQKPILLSTGASFVWEIQRTIDMIRKADVKYCLLHCVLNYPTEMENANLGMISTLKSTFPDAVLGYSDHTLPENIDVITTSYILGSRIIEKHFTFDKSLPGNDHYHAMDKNDLKKIVEAIEHTRKILGSYDKIPLKSEKISRKNARRSLVAAKDITANERVTENHLTWKRPAFGIGPEDYDLLLGKKALHDISIDTILKWNMFS